MTFNTLIKKQLDSISFMTVIKIRRFNTKMKENLFNITIGIPISLNKKHIMPGNLYTLLTKLTNVKKVHIIQFVNISWLRPTNTIYLFRSRRWMASRQFDLKKASGSSIN